MTDACSEEWFEQLWLPFYPLASDDLRDGVHRTSRGDALEKRYIETNPQALSNLLVVDIDQCDAVFRALFDRDGWRPNAVVENPSNGHAHAVWALSTPVVRTEYAKRKPLAYAAAVTEGLRRSVEGDAAYSGLMTKNPGHESWKTYWVTEHLYSLDELRFWLDEIGFMPPPSWRRTRRKNPIGLGRNCALFETARVWAYREVRHHWGDSDGLGNAIESVAQEMNHELFSAPLSVGEVSQIARSIHRWIVTKSRMWADGPAVYEATFVTMQSARGKKSGVSRRSAKRDQVMHLIEVGHE